MSGPSRRAISLVALSVFVMTVILVVVFVSARSDHGGGEVTRISESTSTTSGQSAGIEPPATIDSSSAKPTEFIYAVRDDTKIVRVSLEDGSSTVVSDVGAALGESSIQSMARTPSGIFYFSGTSGCSEDANYWILKPESSLLPEGPYPGGLPTPSPDGTRLAVTFAGPDIDGTHPGDLGASGCKGVIITEIEESSKDGNPKGDGIEIAMRSAGTEGAYMVISDIIWTADGTAVVMEEGYEGVGYETFSADGSGMLPNLFYAPPGFPDRGSYGHPRFFPDGSLLATVVCNMYEPCDDNPTQVLKHYDIPDHSILASWDTPYLKEVIVEPAGSRIVYTIDGGPDASSLVLIDERGTERILGTGFSPTAITW